MTTTADKPVRSGKKKTKVAEEGTSGPRPAATGQTPKSRRRWWVLAIGVVVIVICSLLIWNGFKNASQSVTVFVTKTAIERGQQVSQGDLTTMEITGGQSTDAIPANNPKAAIGKVAAVDLPEGSLVTRTNVLSTLPVPDGKTIVGVALTRAQAPSYTLVSGDKVRIVDTPVAQGEPPANPPKTFNATVFTTRFDDKNNVTIVDLIVPTQDAAEIAAHAATQRIALLLDGTGE